MKRVADRLCSNHYATSVFVLITTLLYWYISTQEQIRHIAVKVPILFYEIDSTKCVVGHESVVLTIEGKKNLLFSLAANEIAVHIDGKKLGAQEKNYTIMPNMVLLPAGLQMVQSVPASIVLSVQTNNTSGAHEEA